MGPPGINKPAHPDLHIPEGGPEHYSVGKAGDGVVYLNDDGEWVKLNARGHPYRMMNVVFAEYQLLLGHQNIPLTSGGGCRQPSERASPRPKRRRLKPKKKRRRARRKSRRVKNEQREKKKRRRQKKPRKPNLPRKTTKTIMFLV